MKKMFLIIISLSILTSCGKPVEKHKRDLGFNNLYYIYLVNNEIHLTDRGKKVDIKIPNIGKLGDFKISPNGSKILFQFYSKAKDGILKNNLYILENNNELRAITDDFASMHPRWSGNGEYIAYMPYTSEKPDSNTGIRIINTMGEGAVISGDKIITKPNYYWVDNDNLIYYGMDTKNGNLKTIYRYNVKEKKEYVYFDKILGYCDFMIMDSCGNKMLLVEGDGLNKYLRLLDNKVNKEVKRDFLLYELYDASFSEDGMYISLVGRQSPEDNTNLFIYDTLNNILYKATSGFPKNVASSSNSHVWNGDLIYFYGKEEKNSIYSYNVKTKEIKVAINNNGECLFPQYIKK